MTLISTATPVWLALRAGADAAARSAELAAVLADLLGPGPIALHDLGAGTGAMTRWLAPRLPGPQAWLLRDGDAGIVHHLDLDDVTDAAGEPVVAEVTIEHLDALPADAFAGASAVTASALLDVLTQEEAERIVAACVAAKAPAFFSLSVTGDVRLHPARPLDGAVAAAFNAHQRRDAGGRRMLGPDAVSVMRALFEAAGWKVRTASTPWRLGAEHRELIAQWLDGWIDAAVEQHPELAEPAERERAHRHSQAAAGRLRVSVGHEDLLVWPA